MSDFVIGRPFGIGIGRRFSFEQLQPNYLAQRASQASSALVSIVFPKLAPSHQLAASRKRSHYLREEAKNTFPHCNEIANELGDCAASVRIPAEHLTDKRSMRR
jgi:hypothetical protein